MNGDRVPGDGPAEEDGFTWRVRQMTPDGPVTPPPPARRVLHNQLGQGWWHAHLSTQGRGHGQYDMCTFWAEGEQVWAYVPRHELALCAENTDAQ